MELKVKRVALKSDYTIGRLYVNGKYVWKKYGKI